MRVCILGENLTSLTLAKALVNLKINVDIVSNNKKIHYIQNLDPWEFQVATKNFLTIKLKI